MGWLRYSWPPGRQLVEQRSSVCEPRIYPQTLVHLTVLLKSIEYLLDKLNTMIQNSVASAAVYIDMMLMCFLYNCFLFIEQNPPLRTCLLANTMSFQQCTG